MIGKETSIQLKVADYLALQYPTIIFHSDFGSGVKLNKVQAALQKRLNGGRKSYPDVFIAQPTKHWVEDKGGGCHIQQAHGLYIELKKDGTKLVRDKDARKILKGEFKLRKKGDWWDQHTEEQALMLEQLRQRGYCAEFAVGFDEAKRIIDEYLKGYKNEEKIIEF